MQQKNKYLQFDRQNTPPLSIFLAIQSQNTLPNKGHSTLYYGPVTVSVTLGTECNSFAKDLPGGKQDWINYLLSASHLEVRRTLDQRDGPTFVHKQSPNKHSFAAVCLLAGSLSRTPQVYRNPLDAGAPVSSHGTAQHRVRRSPQHLPVDATVIPGIRSRSTWMVCFCTSSLPGLSFPPKERGSSDSLCFLLYASK